MRYDKDGRDALLGILALFYLVYLVNADSLRLSGGDWNTLAYFRSGMHGFSEIVSLLGNRWSEMPRVQFLNNLWWAAMAKVFGFWAAPYFAVILGAHFAGALLTRTVFRRLGFDELAARGAAIFYLAVPSSAGALFVVFYSWLVFPCAMLLLLVWLYLSPPRRSWLDLLSLVSTSLTCQFLGDQTVALLYWVLLCLGLRELARSPRPIPGRSWARATVPAAVSLAALAAYWAWAVRPFKSAFVARWDAAALVAFGKGLLLWQLQALDAASWMFGGLSIAPSAITMVLVPTIAVVLWALLGHAEAEKDSRPRLSFAAAALAGGFLAALAPLFYSVLIGYRAEAETRYLYAPGLVLALLAAIGIEASARRFWGPTAARVRRTLFLCAGLYASALMAYDLRDIWGTQKRVEERIWASIDANFPPRPKYVWDRLKNPHAKYIITDGLQRATLVPYNRSNALGDFFEAFGIEGRLRVLNGVDLIPVRRPLAERGDWVVVQPYWQPPRLVPKSELFAVVFRYGPAFADLKRGLVLTFPSYDEYKRYRIQEGLAFND